MDWQQRAECARKRRDGRPFYDAELWQPIGTTGSSVPQIADAKRVCGRCPVRAECLDYALTFPIDSGVLGGLTEEERRALKRRGARARAKAAGLDAPPDPAPPAPRKSRAKDGSRALVDAGPARLLIAGSGLPSERIAHRCGLDKDTVWRIRSGVRDVVTQGTLDRLTRGLAAVTS